MENTMRPHEQFEDIYYENYLADESKFDHLEIRIADGHAAFLQAMVKEPPRPRSRRAIMLYAACVIGFLCSTMNGFDVSLYNNLQENQAWRKYFHTQNSGISDGVISGMYQIGGVVALPFVGPAIDTWGRRVGMFIGAILVVIGTVAQGLGNSVESFMGGRFVLGFGVSVASAAGPMYVVEVSHPAYRGVMTAFYNTWWFTGSILASGASRGADNLKGDITWRIPVWLQLAFSAVIVIFVYFIPESPRWLYVNNREQAAKDMLTRYHGEGNPESEWVRLQMSEYNELLEIDGADKRWWDYRALFHDKSSRYRLYCNCCVAVFGQWAGNAVLSYFISSVLDVAGYTDTISQANITLINNCQQFFWAMCGSTIVDRVGRRPLLLFSNFGCCLVWLAMTISSQQFETHGGSKNLAGTDHPAGKACLAFIFTFGAIYSLGITPLQALYPVEVLSFEMRAKGMAFSSFAVSAANLINQYAWPVSMQKLGWKTYIIFTIWCFIQGTVIFLTIPETKNRTLEELDEIFQSSNPVKTSLLKKKLGLDAYGDVINIGVIE
ncbi:sugar transporter hexose transporter [Coleophoma cylindrospora]|uniref:Sugar transporter hexose transporter n=1 Tax=Coleophoma cylindrospora TaxID=1849047 RepID=A0A3D8S9A9_9HELO|nr:sugar transporter hexose transporter [Coleophoma cylindrospora]